MTELARLSTMTLRASADDESRNRRTEKPYAAPSAQATHTGTAVVHEQRLLGSDTLLQGRSHVLITHNGETYQLRATRLGKLILTK
jgi:hemin uptake protein HemP